MPVNVIIEGNYFLFLIALLAFHRGTSQEMNIQTIPVKISETGQAKYLSRYSIVNLCTEAAIPPKPEKKKDFICLVTLPKTKIKEATGRSIR